jgi:hypothetical protein
MVQAFKSGMLRLRSRIIRAWEYYFLRKYGRDPMGSQPVFIIGAPRCGSTILYQAITNYFDVLYIDNLACRWHDNLFYGFRLSRKRFGNKPHGNFEAEHGSTVVHGDHAPSECGQFWYRWLPSDRHFIDDNDITVAMVNGIRREIIAISNCYRRPVVFKNLNAGQRLRLLKRCFPDARFIHVRRDREPQVRSILAARHQLGIGQGEWWSVKPAGHKRMLELPEPEMVAAQVAGIEQQIEVDLRRFPHKHSMDVQMKDFSADLVVSIGAWLGLERRQDGTMPEFRRDDVLRSANEVVPKHG